MLARHRCSTGQVAHGHEVISACSAVISSGGTCASRRRIFATRSSIRSYRPRVTRRSSQGRSLSSSGGMEPMAWRRRVTSSRRS